MKLSDPIEVPLWLRRAATPAASLFLLWCAVDFLNWQFLLPLRRTMLWGAGSERCFDNGQPLMPLAAFVHAMLCPGVINGEQVYPERLHDDFVRLCVYGGVIGVWLAARALAGWWSAGIAAAFMATNPFMFALDNEVSPASLGVFFAILSCWFAAEAFGRRRPGHIWPVLWLGSAVLAIGTHADTTWIVAAQVAYALIAHRATAPKAVALTALIASAAAALTIAFAPSAALSSALVRYDVRAVLENIFTFSYPDEWIGQPHMATYLSVAVLAVLVGGALAARSTALPYFVAAVAVQTAMASTFSISEWAKLTSLAYLVPIAAMALGAMTAFLIARKPHTLAFVVPAFAVAAQYAAFVRLPLQSLDELDFDFSGPLPAVAFAVGDRLRLYHDSGHAEYVSVFRSIDGIKHGHEMFREPTMTAVTVTGVSLYRIQRHAGYAYRVSAEANSWHGLVGAGSLWPDLAPGSCVRQPYDKVRLYERPDVAFREEGHSRLEPPGTVFQTSDVNATAYQPDLRVRVVHGQDAGREGWIYGQTLLLGVAADANKAAGYACTRQPGAP